MTTFKKTVEKLASHRDSPRLLAAVPSVLIKNAQQTRMPWGPTAKVPSWAERIFGGEHATGPQKLLTGLAQSAAIGGGGYLMGKGLDYLDDRSDVNKARRVQEGRYEAEDAQHKQLMSSLKPLHSAAFKQVAIDPIIAKADPNLINSSFATMKRFAPRLSSDPNAVLSFLREHAIYGTGPSYASLKNLADAEKSISVTGGFGSQGGA